MTDFAPRGASKFQERIRNKLPKPLDTKVAQHSEAIGKFYDACAVCFFFFFFLIMHNNSCLLLVRRGFADSFDL